MEYSAAIDLSGSEAAFAVGGRTSGAIVFSAVRPMTGRNSAELAPWMFGLLNSAGIELEQIVEWTVGSGPGSFTGMRLAAALVAGLVFGRPEVRTRCVPTAVALAASAGSVAGNRIAAVFDGRNREILVFEMFNRDGEIVPSGRTSALDETVAPEFFADGKFTGLVALSKDAAAIAKVIGAAALARFKLVEHLAPEELIRSRSVEWNNDLTDLAYIRPAVFTVPATA